jgi:hypothetical protein
MSGIRRPSRSRLPGSEQWCAISGGGRQPSQLSTQSKSTPLLFDLAGTAVTSISTVWITFGRSQSLPRRVPRNAVRTKPVSLARRTRLGPNRVAHKESNHVCQPRSRRPRTCRDGRVGITTEYVVARAAVPDLEARLFGTRPSPPGAHGLAVVPFPFPPRLPRIRPRSAKLGQFWRSRALQAVLISSCCSRDLEADRRRRAIRFASALPALAAMSMKQRDQL